MKNPNDDYEHQTSIIDNINKAKNDFGKACGWDDIILSKEHVDALNNGKCIAVYDGEYVNFISFGEKRTHQNES